MAGEHTVQRFLDDDTSLDTDSFRRQVTSIDERIHAIRSSDWEMDDTGGELNGLPVSVKDNICVEGFPATAGSKILESYRPPFTATAVRRLQEKGANVFAKTNQDEFGFGTFSTNSAYEVPRNPYDTDRVTGGSSGGAAALTAAIDQPHVALGQSTGGSISCPAAFCGVVGLTPTYGRVSRYGLIDYANSLDKIGPIANTVSDAATVLDIIAGNDKNDVTTVDKDVDIMPDDLDLSGTTIGVPEQYMRYDGVDSAVRDEVWDAIKRFEELGATYEEVSIPEIARDVALPAYYMIAVSEASTNLARFCGIRYGLEGNPEKKGFNEYFREVRSKGFGEEAKRRILLGHFARMAGYRDAYYVKALKVRRLVIEAFEQAFNEYDVLMAPTMPITAPKIEEVEDLSPVEAYAMDTLTVGPNLAGIPQLSLPTGMVDGLPVGTHILAPQFGERELVRFGMAYEQEFGLVDAPSL